MALPPSTTVTVVEIDNPRLSAAAHDFLTVTEHKDLPRVVECQDGEGVLWSSDEEFSCQDGCGTERPFAFVVEPGDTIPLQFQLQDFLNTDPENPALGWRGTSGEYWLEIEVLDTAGNLIWSGPTPHISEFFEVGWSGGAGYQSIVVDVDMLLAQLPEGTTCWSFRVKVFSSIATGYTIVDAETAPSGTPATGYTYIDFGSGDVLQWNGTSWVVVGPTRPNELFYVVETAHWYLWNGTSWVGLAEPPDLPEPAFEYVYTMNYRLRNCDEPVVKVCCTLSGRDCLGFQHDPKPPEYNMPAIPGVTFVDFWIRDAATPVPGVFVGATATGPAFNSIMTYTADGWQLGPPLAAGTQILIMNNGLWPWVDASAGYTNVDIIAGTLMTLGSWVPFVGYWDRDGMVWDEIPGTDFIPGMTQSQAFQLCFGLCGSIEVQEYGIETEVTRNNRRLSTTPSTVGRLRTTGIPEGVAQLLQLALSAPVFTINGEPWDEASGLRKNNDEGLHWWIDTTITRDECEVRGLCE